MARPLGFFDNIPNADKPEDSVLNSLLYDFFRFPNFKNMTQRNATVEILKRVSDVIVSLPKGSGRTLCFQLPMLISLSKVSIVFVGRASRIKEQTNRLTRANIYVEILSAATSSTDWIRIYNHLFTICHTLRTLNAVLYVTLDVLLNDYFMNLVDILVEDNHLGYIVVDESYCENDWLLTGEKDEYHALRLLKNLYNHIPWVVATTETSTEVINCIKTELCLSNHGTDLSSDSIPWFGLNLLNNEEVADR